jgi:hypothetical protein
MRVITTARAEWGTTTIINSNNLTGFGLWFFLTRF